MSLHGSCVTQHSDSLMKITSVLGMEKLPLPEELDFPRLFTEGGRFPLRSARLQSTSYMSTDWSAGSQTASSRTHSGFLFFLSLGFLPSLHCIQFILSIHAFTLNLPPPILPSLPSYLSLWPNVGLQMKQLDFHLRLKGIDMCCSVSGRTLSASPMLSHKGERGRQIKCPQLLARKHGKQAAIIQLFIAHIYYTAWAANNNKCTSWSDTMPWLGPCLLKQTGLWNKSRVCAPCGR